MNRNTDRHGDFGVFFRGGWNIYHSGSPIFPNYWAKTRCGLEISEWGHVPFRLLDPARVRPCKKCYPNERQES